MGGHVHILSYLFASEVDIQLNGNWEVMIKYFIHYISTVFILCMPHVDMSEYHMPVFISCINPYIYPIILDNDGSSPFFHACAAGQIDVLDWLLAHGVPDTEMTEASMYACMHFFGGRGGGGGKGGTCLLKY